MTRIDESRAEGHTAEPNRRSDRMVAGIDVGGTRKGFHAVALLGQSVVSRLHCREVDEVAGWCATRAIQVVAIDAPCRWRDRDDAPARMAERELLQRRISCFVTPTRATASADLATRGQRSFYAWMLRGECLYRALSSHYPLLTGLPIADNARCSFETFPQAVALALAGRTLAARDKRSDRKHLLDDAHIDTTQLPGIDWIDAALCALVAQRVAASAECSVLGDAATGLIVVPPLRARNSGPP